MAVDCGTDVVFDSKETIAIYNSSEWAARGFCRLCGSHLFYRLKGTGQYMMPVGLFGEVEGLIFERQVFIDEKPSFYCFSNMTAGMTGQAAFA